MKTEILKTVGGIVLTTLIGLAAAFITHYLPIDSWLKGYFTGYTTMIFGFIINR